MSRTKEDLIQQFLEVHNNFYSYEKFKYEGVMKKSIVTCPNHGDFEVTPNSHYRGSGCQKCYDERRKFNRLLTKEEFVEKSNLHHLNKYDYSKALYETQYIPVIIICPLHGIFEQKPVNHMRGMGCQKCKNEKLSTDRRKSLEQVIEEFKQVHENRYTYELCTEYKNQKSRMKITCPHHGVFEMTATNHLSGKGCTGCAINGYNKTSSAYIYILEYNNLTKIGISGVKPSKRRLSEIRRSSGKDFTIYETFYHENGGFVYEIEQKVLKYFSTLYEQPREIFDGSTECFYDLNPETAKQYIAELIQQTQCAI